MKAEIWELNKAVKSILLWLPLKLRIPRSWTSQFKKNPKVI
ncbi:hypothetical protein [uncultured Methanobrevibacter sp.]|nr:hypothetical protein [uncultured Methanobrevibacter sp.]